MAVFTEGTFARALFATLFLLGALAEIANGFEEADGNAPILAPEGARAALWAGGSGFVVLLILKHLGISR